MLLVAILLSWLAPRSTHFRFQLEPALILIILCSIALLPRLIQLDHLGIFLDERYWIEDAQGFLKGTVISPFGFIGDQPSNMPSLIVALVLQVSGNIYYAARLPGIFYSLGCIMFLFFYAKKSFGMLVAFLATLLVATSIWDIHMSRWGWNNVTPGPFIIMGIIYCYSEFLYRPRIHMALLCGFFLGIAVNLLYVSMLMVIPILGTIPLLMIGRGLFISEPKRIQYSRMTLLRMLGIVALALFITMSPTIAKVRKYPSQSIQRHKSFVAENLKVSENSASGLLFYGEQFVLAVRDFTPDLSKERITGLWGKTPKGDFTIWTKIRSTRMSGGSGADYYDLPNVPYVMFFSNDEVAASTGFSIHGTYWHNNFGHAMSHGCVNMKTTDVAKLFEWAEGPQDGKKGTVITIYSDSTM
jgi:hypothetical protein